jgi:hypothetical protein
LKGDRRGPVKSTGLRDGFDEESALVTGSLCASLAKPVSFWTRSLKVFMSACTKVVGDVRGEEEEEEEVLVFMM